METKKKRVFSGIQPTGDIHIGNYLGAIKNWVASQDDYDNIFCVVDLHAITVPQDPKVLKRKTRELAALLLAAGIDPAKSVLFVQSQISAHCELAWIMNCSIPMGWLERMTQFKEKSGANKERVSVGLFDYPALMAADVLLYDADGVPVGEDQKQHVELMRDAAQRFNAQYGDTFVVPEPIIPKLGARIMGLDDPTKKMSKSEDAQNHAIKLLDPPDVIRRKFKRATTDSERTIVFDENRLAMTNLLTIYGAFSGWSNDAIEAHFEGKGYGDLKKELAEVVIAGLEPIQARFKELMADRDGLTRLLRSNADQVRPIAEATVRRARKRLGLE